jgi:hypothetical protein
MSSRRASSNAAMIVAGCRPIPKCMSKSAATWVSPSCIAKAARSSTASFASRLNRPSLLRLA